MTALLKEKLFLVLLALLALTLFSALLGEDQGPVIPMDKKMLGVLLLVIAFLKVRLVVIHFMEANRASRPVRVVFEMWIVLVGLVTVGLYL